MSDATDTTLAEKYRLAWRMQRDRAGRLAIACRLAADYLGVEAQTCEAAGVDLPGDLVNLQRVLANALGQEPATPASSQVGYWLDRPQEQADAVDVSGRSGRH
ncbi:MAG: hypothetical protein NTU85_03570 [Candidatus Kaiserbacteria bacterium]|nr:hypothetical protein [Candidatus Kaiserbacteria bacterium]